MKTVTKIFDCDNRCQQYAIWIFFMEIELYLTRKKKTVLLEFASYNVPRKV